MASLSIDQAGDVTVSGGHADRSGAAAGDGRCFVDGGGRWACVRLVRHEQSDRLYPIIQLCATPWV